MNRKLAFMIITILMAASAAQPQGTTGWEIFGRMPLPVSGGEAVVHDSSIFVLGGYSDSLSRAVNWIQKYRPSAESWQTIGTMRVPRQHFVAGDSGTHGYYFGGSSAPAVQLDSTIEIANLLQPSVTSFFDTNTVFAREFSAGLIKNGKFYIFGGDRHASREQAYLVEYDLQSRAITFRLDTLFGSSGVGQMVASIGNDIFVFGGVTNTHSRNIYRFNTSTRNLQRLPVNLITPRAFGRAILLGNDSTIMILGGSNEVLPALNTVEIFELRPGGPGGPYQISPGAPLRIPRVDCMAAYLNGYVYVLGGQSGGPNPIEVPTIERSRVITDVRGPDESQIVSYSLMQNYPNPFNPITAIRFSIPVGTYGHTSLQVYDVLGREVATVVNEAKQPGTYTVQWDASRVSSGIYFYHLRSGAFVATKRMVLIR